MQNGRLWLAVLAAAITAAATNVHAQAPLERGKYLVEGILTCGNCHTPRGPKGVLDSANRHAGGPQVWETAEYRVRPSNITPDKDSGIGGRGAAQVTAAKRARKRPKGQQISPPKPPPKKEKRQGGRERGGDQARHPRRGTKGGLHAAPADGLRLVRDDDRRRSFRDRRLLEDDSGEVKAAYSALMPALLMRGHHLSISALW